MPDPAITFTPVTLADIPMLRGWMDLPHWRQWWGDPATELGHIIDMIEGRDGTEPFIFRLDGQALGYIQNWFIGPHQTEEWARDNPWLMELPANAVGVDLSIGDPAWLGQGLGTRVLRAFVARLRAAGHGTIIIDPDPLNTRAVAAYRKAGFTPIPDLEGRTEGVLIMRHEAGAGPP